MAWLDRTFAELARQMRWSYLPPLMVYLAAGISGLTSVVGTFFVKDYLDLSAAFLAGLAFWAGIPWVLKMPLGHLVDLIWRWKAVLVWLGAALIGCALFVLYSLVAHTGAMRAIMPLESWYVIAMLLTPTGYVIQDVVADAMTVEAVPRHDAEGAPLPEAKQKAMHTTMQTLGRFAIISGFTLVAVVNIVMFDGAEGLSAEARAALYARIYLIALVIPLVSVAGVTLAAIMQQQRAARLRTHGLDEDEIARRLSPVQETTSANWQILGGGLVFVALTLTVGLTDPPFAQELVFLTTLAVILFLVRSILAELEPQKARALIGTAVIIFVFRATPLVGPGYGWFQIDVLRFDEQFLSILSLITSALTLAGLIVLRPMMANRSIAWIVVFLTLAATVLAGPNLGLVFGLHEWTAAVTGGIVDARFIAIVDTAVESPLGQIAMVPMLAWIARNAPAHLKATFFAVMAGFTNLALSAASLGTKYLNELYLITREVRDAAGEVSTPADYSLLGPLLITVVVIGLLAPLITVGLVQISRYRTSD